ncbi:MAG: hypothetical protein FWD58_09945 [Firmicutes bacterium]|nr:hypothetical protein [Bacillota bacterium]
MKTKKQPARLLPAVLAVFLTALMLLGGFMPAVNAVRTASAAIPEPESAASDAAIPSLSTFNDELKSGAKWKSMVNEFAALTDVAPASLSSSYELEDDVIEVNSKSNAAVMSAVSNIATVGMRLKGETSAAIGIEPNAAVAQGAYVNKDALAGAIGAANVKNGAVVFDKGTATAFQLMAPFGGYSISPDVQTALNDTYMVTAPKVNDIFKKVNIGRTNAAGVTTDETVALTYGNFDVPDEVAGCVETDKIMSALSDQSRSKAVPLSSGITETAAGFEKISKVNFPLEFRDKVLTAYKSDGVGVNVKLSGGLGFGDFQFVGHYSLPFGSYKAAFQFTQEFYLIATVEANLHEEVFIPLAGLSISFGIGSVKGGLFLVIGLDGNFRIEFEVREWTKTELGVGGKTFFCFPVNCGPVFKLKDIGTYGNIELNGRVNAYARLGPMIDIEVCGINLVGAGAFLGAGADVKVDGADLDITLYGIINVYVKAFGKTFNVINEKPKILHKRQKDTGGLLVNIVDCFNDPGRVGGTIKKQPSTPLAPYVAAPNIRYLIKIKPASGSVKYYPGGVTAKPASWSWPVTNQYGEC